jgi:hypothetical protein
VVRTGYFRVTTLLVAMMAATIVAVLASYAPAEAQTATDTLKQPPFAPTDTSLFLPGVYSDAPPTEPASSGPTGEATLKQKLRDLLNQRFPGSPKKVNQALAIFDSEDTKAKVPDPRLRAALVALKGTAGEPAIAGVLDGTYESVHLASPSAPGSCGDACVAQVVSFPDGHREIYFSDKYQFEDFRLLASTMAHEALHRDNTVTLKEELAANSISTLIYGQFVLEDPSLAALSTELTRANNTQLMARINTRDVDGNLRLFTSTGGIFPGGNFVPYFAAPFEPLGGDTPGNVVLKGELKRVVGKVPK